VDRHGRLGEWQLVARITFELAHGIVINARRVLRVSNVALLASVMGRLNKHRLGRQSDEIARVKLQLPVFPVKNTKCQNSQNSQRKLLQKLRMSLAIPKTFHYGTTNKPSEKA